MIIRMRFLTLMLFVAAVKICSAQPSVGTWRNTGPVPFPINVTGQVNGMGRVSQIKFHPSNPAKMYAVSSSGGLFISTDTGRNWHPTPGTEVLPTTACSAVCIDYTNDNIIYLSTGDQNYYGDWYGIYKSTDGGNTWNPANAGIGIAMAVDIIMDPTNHQTIVAATDNGIWKSTDGATTWTQTLDSGAMKSMQIRRGGGRVLYAATGMNFFKSNDFGSSWVLITTGVTPPAGNEGMRIAVTPADTNIVYLGTTGGYGEIMKSIDGGNSFTMIYTCDTQCIVCYDSTVTSGSQGYYNYNFAVSPTNPNELILGSHCVWQSTDGGLTWHWRTQWWHQIHTDMHQLEFDPYRPAMRWNANDGGVWATTDSTVTNWYPRCDGMAATEMYHSSQCPVNRQLVAAGCQDNGELYYDGVWKCNRGGDWGAKQNMDYTAKGTVYYDNGSRRDLSPLSGDYSYNKPFTVANQFNIQFSKLIGNTCVLATDSVWISRNITAGTPTWTFLYTNGEDILSLAMSKADSNTIYFVTNNNHLIRCENVLSAAPTFYEVYTPGATNVAACVTTDKYNANIVYLSCNNQMYRSNNKGVSWTNITFTLPTYNILKVISDDYSPTERLFVCSGSYVFYKDNTSSVWSGTVGLPTVANFTDMLVYNDSTSASILRLSTYGRGAWELNLFNNYPPSGSFSGSKQLICAGDTVKYSKNLYGNVSSFTWYFPGGTPATSVADSPTVVYTGSGVFDAELVAIGAYGTDTVKYTNYINVYSGDTTSYVEGFEEATFPPSALYTQISESGLHWQRKDSIGGYGASWHSMYFDNFNNDAGGRHDRFVLPKVDLSYALSATLKFDVAYAYYPGYRDTLQVEVSADCERTFLTVYQKDTSYLATASDTSGNFVPSAAQWRTDSISLNAFIGEQINVAFDNIGHYGQNIYIDNINLQIHMPPLAGNDLAHVPEKIYIFPNPARGSATLQYSGLNTTSTTINISNELGQTVLARHLDNLLPSGSILLDVSGFVSGLYIVEVRDDKNFWVGKLMVE
jgi:photosystem II stability/assembly factor-like uncharacterized protein/PKD repeat protein